MNSKNIEREATIKIESMANSTMKIEPDVNSNDTKISFDGELVVYNSEDLRKSNFIGKIQIQVKGKQVAKRGGKVIHRNNVKVNDLKVYEKEGGVYYFVVYLIVVNNKVIDKQVYGKQLHLLDLRRLLQKKQKSVTIEMYEIENENVLYSNCVKYLSEKQSHNPLKQIKVKNTGKNLSYVATPENIVMDHRGFPLNDFYGYIDINSPELEATIPDSILSMEKIKRVKERKVIKNGEVLFEGKISFVVAKESTSIIINDIFKLQVFENSNKSTYSMMPFNKLNIEEKSFYIINEISKGGDFNIDNIELSINPFNINVTEIRDIINNLKNKISEYRNLIPIDKKLKPIDFNDQMNEIVGLIELLEYKRFENYNIQNNGYCKMQFSGKYIVLFRYDDLLYNAYSNDFLSKFQAVVKEEEGEVQMPIIYTLTRDMIVDVLNFDINVIKEIIVNDELDCKSEIKWEKLNNFALELIASYDETQKVDLLDLADYILKNLLNFDYDKKFMNLINQAQIMKRRNIIDDGVISKLIELREKLINIDEKIATLYINVLSGSKQEAKIRYENLDYADLEMFNAYPILKLYKNLMKE